MDVLQMDKNVFLLLFVLIILLKLHVIKMVKMVYVFGIKKKMNVQK